MRKTITASVIDQFLVSGSMFGLNLVLIWLATPGAYGHFILVFGLYLLAFGAQHALVLLPVSVLFAGRSHARQNATLRMLSTLDLALVVSTAILVAGLAALFSLSALLCLGAGLLVITLSTRELARTVFITRQEPRRLLVLDLIFISATWVALPALWHVTAPAEATVFALALGSAMASVAASPALHRQPLRLQRALKRYNSYWQKSRWALVGAGLTEAQLRLYIFVVELARGSAALGVLHAGRVMINPITMAAFAWGKAIRPVVASHLDQGEAQTAFRFVIKGLGGLMVFAIGYYVALFAAWPWLEPHIFATANQDFGTLLLLWAIFGIVSLPTIALTIFLQAQHRFRELTAITAVSVATSSLLLMSMFLELDLSWAIVALLIGEVVMALCLGARVRSTLRAAAPTIERAIGDVHV